MLIEDDIARIVRHIGFSERGLADWINSLRFSLSEVAEPQTDARHRAADVLARRAEPIPAG